MFRTLLNLSLAALATLLIAQSAKASADISSFAFVRDDGTLQVSNYLVHLYGIYIPPTDRTCHTFIRPVPCGSRASLALDFRISGDFIRCRLISTNPDGSIIASCTSGDENLSEWMLRHGWAVALPEAPFSYAALERIAQSRGVGIWGIPVETRRKRPPP